MTLKILDVVEAETETVALPELTDNERRRHDRLVAGLEMVVDRLKARDPEMRFRVVAVPDIDDLGGEATLESVLTLLLYGDDPRGCGRWDYVHVSAQAWGNLKRQEVAYRARPGVVVPYGFSVHEIGSAVFAYFEDRNLTEPGWLPAYLRTIPRAGVGLRFAFAPEERRCYAVHTLRAPDCLSGDAFEVLGLQLAPEDVAEAAFRDDALVATAIESYWDPRDGSTRRRPSQAAAWRRRRATTVDDQGARE